MLRITSVRPSTDVPFFIASQEFTDYYNENYIKTGKSIQSTDTLPDDLTRIVVDNHTSQESLDAFRDDRVVMFTFLKPMLTHDAKNGIVTTFVVEDIE